jgi:hypothetical protein
MRSKMLLVTFVVFGSILVAGALAATPRQAATDQYQTTPVIGAGTTNTTPTDVVAPTVTGSTTPTTPAVSPPTTTDTSATTPTATATTPTTTPTTPAEEKGGSAAAGAAGPDLDRVEHLDFGRADKLPLHQPFKKLREDVVASIAQTPYHEDLLDSLKDHDRFGGITNARFAAFAASPLLKLLSDVAVEPAGQAWGAQMVNVTPVARQVFPVLLGTDELFVSFVRVVLTRRATLAKGEAKFMDGVAKGLESTGIPVAYVERADVKKSFIKHFKKLGILTVDDVDTPTGKLRLARILTGQITTQKAVDEVKVDPASATIVDTDGSAGATPWLLLVLVLGGAGFAASGVLRHRGSRSRASRTSA